MNMRSKISKLKRGLQEDSDSVPTNRSPAKKRKIDESPKPSGRLQSNLPLKKRLTSVFEKENELSSDTPRSPTKRKSPDKVLKNVNLIDDDSDSDIDEIFMALKKGGIRADRSKIKSPKTSPDKTPSKKVPELEKSPDSLIINHKRTPKKKGPELEKSTDCSVVEQKKTPKKKVPELEKSGEYLIIEHKRTPKKKVDDDFESSPRSSPRKLAKTPTESAKNTVKEHDTSPFRKSSRKTPKKTDNEKNVLCTPKSTRSTDIAEGAPARSPLILKLSLKKTPKVIDKEKDLLSTPKSTRRSNITEDATLNSPEPARISRRSSRLKRCETPEPEEKKISSSKKSSSKKKEKYEPVTPSTRRIIAEQPRTPLEKARQSLHVSTIPDALPCREKEFKNVLMFLENKLQDGIGGCMYISGVPGTGKTATVTQVIRHLQDLVKEGTMPEFKFLEINGMRLADPRQAYVQICQQLFGNKEKLAPDKALQKLDGWFSKNDRKNNKINTVLLVDELDLICTKKQEVIYNILDWPTRIHSRLIVLTIANTMDMPERLFKGRVTSRLGLTRLTFMPYTHKQLEEIVLARLTGLNAFSHDAVQLVTRKVAAVSGDARRALDICRRATELPAPDETVTIKHIDRAIREMTHSNIARVIRSCSEMEKLFLKSMSDVSVHSGLEEVDFLRVIDQFFAACALEGIKKPPVSSLISLSNRLKCFRLIYTNQSSGGILQKLTLNVTRDDIYYALNDKVNSSEF